MWKLLLNQSCFMCFQTQGSKHFLIPIDSEYLHKSRAILQSKSPQCSSTTPELLFISRRETTVAINFEITKWILLHRETYEKEKERFNFIYPVKSRILLVIK